MTADAAHPVPGAIGVDGCKGGWIAAIRLPDGDVAMRVAARFVDIVAGQSVPAPVVVDMPIGLPDAVGRGGRGPEAEVRPLLGARRSSVFSIASRAAVYAEPGPYLSPEERYAAHRRAGEVARATSDPARAVSIQAFGLFAKIREIDGLLRALPDWRPRLRESHPEVAFWQLNGRRAMRHPKKVEGRVHGPGMDERRDVLRRHGVPRHVLEERPRRGAAADDALDACAMLLVAERVGRGEARPFPDPPGIDPAGIPIAIWA